VDRQETTPKPPSSPEQGAGIPLQTEPTVFFHPLLAGTGKPGSVQPFSGHPLLEEEPAVWVQFVT
jgi:hypothetical protein